MMNKKWVVIILSLALIMLIMPQNITAEDNSVNYDNLTSCPKMEAML